MVLVTMYAIPTKAEVFCNRVDFNLGVVYAVVDNCTIVIVLNNILLFNRLLKIVNDIGIITIAGEDHHSIHKGTASLLSKDNNGKIYHIRLPDALYFPSSSIDILSIGKISLFYRNSSDKGDCGM